jgi:hypothetical protein
MQFTAVFKSNLHISVLNITHYVMRKYALLLLLLFT